ncbi:GlxA family transcriptional regulator [Bordetella hinzii]|uniref:DNA-binding helix-turn-helix protein n=1 Tax=Bordetella hinzii OH87 BAL007II TaxID=1331262 RepID=A0ABR4R1F0_9BORD|nr:GlxA family transcriptional regulator [Bordetella hinzii]KCB23807.1 DNA-binding helix-turn-helix protein [Bordetella hinzii OH87 BAL007II]KCB38973.1 DNA-binding helix-turn-helix protein [Bordetella hinzii CA90 BAL1384]KCB43145.1 DNA-binding helix-turn-helix protein [Bordetella hinzii 5132]QDJ42337.1 AraC family transcriptional regulator [Bordetella hinzii]QDJ46905.1 AraC family transcriptional regulator [Bordetella hinzii]
MHRVSFLLADGFQVMSIAPQSVFEFANLVAGQPFYAIDSVSLHGGQLRSSLGLSLITGKLGGRADTLMVAGWVDPSRCHAPSDMLAAVRRVARRARRVAGVCTGGFVLAEAGLLDGRRATTHWAWARALQQAHPAIQVEPDRIYVVDGPFWTSAGMTACLDMALFMVEQDLGADVARTVARKLVMHQRRAGGQSQHSEMLDLAPRSDRIQNSLAYARAHLASALPVEELARVANLSPRQFSRVFTKETGQSPAKAIEGLRLEAARLMIEQSRHPLETVARETGFRDRRHMREAFLRGFGLPPQAVRREARGA